MKNTAARKRRQVPEEYLVIGIDPKIISIYKIRFLYRRCE